MNSIWVHGTYFIEFEGDYYHHNLTSKIWEERYLKYFDHITVCSRVKHAKSKEEISGKYLSISKDDSRMSFCGLNVGLFASKTQTAKIKELLNSVDVAIIRLPSTNGYKVASLAVKLNKKYMTEIVGCIWDALTTHSIKGKLTAPLFFCRMKRAAKNANFAFYVTNKFLQGRYKTNGISCSCSDVKIGELDNTSFENRINLARNFSYKSTVNLVTIGAVDVKYKGQEFVIRAIAQLKEQGYDFKYFLIGGGNTSRLQNLADELNVGENIVFTGNLTHDKVYQLLDSAHIYIHPSLTEGLPRSVLEAKSRGCAVICSDVGGIPEIVDKSHLFKKKDVQAIKKLIVSYVPKTLEEEAKTNIEFVKHFVLNNSDEVRHEFMKNVMDLI